MAPRKNKKRKSPTMWNWEKLKAEFFAGDWNSVSEFAREKKIGAGNSIRMKGWVEEKRKLNDNALKKATQSLMQRKMQDIMEVRLRQQAKARRLQEIGSEVLDDLDLKTIPVKEARLMLIAGLIQEREALGFGFAKDPQSLTQININAKTDLEEKLKNADYEGVLRLIAEVKRERTRRTGDEDTASSEEEKGRRRDEQLLSVDEESMDDSQGE